jgi:hypothetical protein
MDTHTFTSAQLSSGASSGAQVANREVDNLASDMSATSIAK